MSLEEARRAFLDAHEDWWIVPFEVLCSWMLAKHNMQWNARENRFVARGGHG